MLTRASGRIQMLVLLADRTTGKLRVRFHTLATACSLIPRIEFPFVGRDSSVGIATRYGLEGPGIESRWGRDFPYRSRPALRPTQPPVQWVPGLSRG